ncbi:tudor domain-containing protein 7-like [Culicoides brevitarsis]|uniref:tudor domain-containing protein 7-like n=1 Tax=Culicoides brevitarsis TaxID=469753 RepID=UPI00307BDE7F
MSLTATQNEAIEVLVGLCSSLKIAPTITQLLQDYADFEGKQLDTSNFKSPVDFLKASGRFELIPTGNTFIVSSKINLESLHILSMVEKQKTYNVRGAPGMRKPPQKFHQKGFRPQNFHHNNNNHQQQALRPLRNVAPNARNPLPKSISPVADPNMTNPFDAATFTKVPKNITPAKSVQNRLAVAKRSISNDDMKPVRHDVPVEWWSTENMGVVGHLEQYCIMKQLPPPDYTYFKVKEGKTYKFQCRVTIEEATYSTYPEDFETKEKAKIVCAARAVENIKLSQGITQYPLFDGDDNELACKMYEIVRQHSTGIFLQEFPNLFRTTYNQSIPSHYISLMTDQYPDLFKIEELSTTQKKIVYPVEGAVLPRLASQSSLVAESPVETSSLLPPHIQLPWTQQTWSILVTFAETTTAVWCNLLGKEHYEARVDLYDEIELAGITEHPTDIITNEYYIAVVHQCPHRIRIVGKTQENDKWTCRFIDTGEEESLESDQIYICDKKFLELPAQAIQLSLEGLSLFAEIENIDYCLTELNDKVLVAKIHTTEEEFRKHRGAISATLYDTTTEEDINMNDKLMEKIRETALEPSKLNEKMNCMVITHVSDKGVILGHLKETGYMELIKKEIKKIVKEGKLKEYAKTVTSIVESEGELYLAYNKNTSNYVRAKPTGLDVNTPDVLTVTLIDYGTDLKVNKKEIYRLRPLSKALEVIPPQAIRMRLHGINNNDDQYMGSLLRGFLKPNMTALVKVIDFSVDAKEPPVSIFVRSAKGTLQSLNDAITSQTSLSPLCDKDPAVPEFNLVPDLPKFVLPVIKQKMQVKVILSQSPQMFYVQPKSLQKGFQQLASTMQKYFETMNEALESTATLQNNGIYAAYREETKEWCRAKLLNIYDQDHIKVSFSDYACIDVIPLKNLRDLPSQFKLLPEQAIKAKLYGVKPNAKVGEAAHRFINLTKNREFEAVLMEVDKVPDSLDRVVTLDLYIEGPEGEGNIYLREVLINEGLADPQN